MDNFRSYQNIQIPSAQGRTSSSSAPRKHDVFLSFRGKDTRHGFTGFLYDALVNKGLKVYRDDEKIPIGKDIRPELIRAIQESKSAIVVLSENYADSTWCLDELADIVKCVERRELILFPVFYRVDPWDVQGNKFDLTEYETNSGIAQDRVDSWRSALSKVGHTAGHHVKEDRYERYDIDEIVFKVSQQLKDDIKHTKVSHWLERVEMSKDKIKYKCEMAKDKIEDKIESLLKISEFRNHFNSD